MKPMLQTRLSQQLTLTPQLQQAIRLLQLSAQELTKEIEDSLENNPLLEICEDTEIAEAADTDTSSIDNQSAPSTTEINQTSDELPEITTQSSDEIASQWQQDPMTSQTRSRSGSSDWEQNFEIKDTSSASLRQHLLWQMQLTPFSETDRAIATVIIDAIDDEGYLTCPLEEILISLGCPEDPIEIDEIEAVLHRIQQFDPIGIGSRNLQEYLLIQLQQFDQHIESVHHAYKIINQHIDLLAKRDFKQLRQVCKIQSKQLEAAISLIQSLNPRPIYQEFDSQTQYIIPDVVIYKHNGNWVVELNNQSIPQVRISPSYASLVSDNKQIANNKSLKEQYQEARWLVKSLESRNETLLKVAKNIMQQQQEFLEKGEVAMKPLILQDVAVATDLHESTISRITSQKYIQTPLGLFELKYFFSSHLPTGTGQERSSTAIRALIKKLVKDETPEKPYSDNKLAQLLKQEHDINIARRTITKYREAMGILPSNERKRLKCK